MKPKYVNELRAALEDALATLERALALDAAPPPSAVEEQGPPDSDFLTLREFLAHLGISYSTYRSLRADGKMPPEIRLTQRLIKFSRLDVEAWQREAARRDA